MARLTGPEIKRRMSNTSFGISLIKKLTKKQAFYLLYLLDKIGICADLRPDIVISPFASSCLGPNSYDVHLAPVLKVRKDSIPDGMIPAIAYDEKTLKDIKPENGDRLWYENAQYWEDARHNPHKYDKQNLAYLQDTKNPGEYIEISIPEQGLILNPRFTYLGCTAEYTETRNLFPSIDGKSTIGRNFLSIHQTAGDGDDGFCGHWTLEITVDANNPVVIYPYMQIGQLYWDKTTGKKTSYANGKHNYNKQEGPTPPAKIKIQPEIFYKVR